MHLQPQCALPDCFAGKASQCIHLFGNAQVVQCDALDCILARSRPVALLETLPRTSGDRRKAGVVLLEASVDGASDARRQFGIDIRFGHAGLIREDRLHHTLACAMASSAKVVPAAGRQHLDRRWIDADAGQRPALPAQIASSASTSCTLRRASARLDLVRSSTM